MIVDLTDACVLEGHGLVAQRSCDFPNNPWRNVLVAERREDVSVQEQAQVLVSTHLAGNDLQLCSEWPAFTPVLAESWRHHAVMALTHGLAYGAMPAISGAHCAGNEVVEEFIDLLLKAFSHPQFSSNGPLTSEATGEWHPVSAHTFDRCLIASDQRRLAVVLVADED